MQIDGCTIADVSEHEKGRLAFERAGPSSSIEHSPILQSHSSFGNCQADQHRHRHHAPPAFRGARGAEALPLVVARPPLSLFSCRFGLALLSVPRRPRSPSAFLPRRRSAAARSRPPTPFFCGCSGGVALGRRVRIVLAPDQLDLRHFGAVAAAVAELEDARVAARARLEARRDGLEQLAHDIPVLQVAKHEPARVQRLAVGVAGGEAALGDA